MKYLITLFLATTLLSQQLQTPVTILPGAGNATGELRLRERRTSSGQNYTGFRARQSLAADIVYDLPAADGTPGQALVTDGALGLSWGSVAGTSVPICSSITGTDAYTCTVPSFTSYTAGYCIILTVDTANTLTATVDISSVGVKSILRYGGSALSTNDILVNTPVMICYNGTDFTLPPSASPGSGAFLDGGNSFGATATLGTNDNFKLVFETNGGSKWEIGTGGDLYPSTNDTGTVGTTGNRSAGTYSRFGVFMGTSSSTASSDYVSTRKYNICDSLGAVGCWDWHADVTVSSSDTFWRDNAGDPAFKMTRQFSGSPSNQAEMYLDFLPMIRETANGHTVTDPRYPRLGSATRPWDHVYSDDGTFGDDVVISDTLQVQGNALLNGAINTMPGTLSPGIDGLGSIGTGAAKYGQVNAYDGNFYQVKTDAGRVQVLGTDIPVSRGGVEINYDSTGDGGAGWGGIEVFNPGSTNPRVMTYVAKEHHFYVGTSSAEKVRIDLNGIATIGHNSAITRLGQNLNLNTSANFAGMAINTWAAADNASVIDLNKSGSDTIGTHAAVSNGNTLGFLIYRGSDGTVFRNGAHIKAEVEGTVSSGIVPGRLEFATASSAGTMTDRLVIDSTGLATFSNTIKITTGAAVGYVLTSDAAGVASWLPAGASSGFDVRSYGAVCDGSTDDTTAVQAAITAANASGAPATVEFPNGYCLVTGISVTVGNIGFRGKGLDKSFIMSTTNAPIFAVDTTASDIYWNSWQDLTILGNGGGSQVAIDVSGPNSWHQSQVTNVRLSTVSKGLYVHTGVSSGYISFSNNFCSVSNECVEKFVPVDPASGWNIVNNRMGSGSPNHVGIYIHGFVGDTVISNNHIEGGGNGSGNAIGIKLYCDDPCTYGENMVVTSNKIDGSDKSIVLHNVSRSTFTGNRGAAIVPGDVTGSQANNNYESDGAIGIGVIPPTVSEKLNVNGASYFTIGASGYSEPVRIFNDSVGLNGSCVALAGHDGGVSQYLLGRVCAKFNSALFTDELVTLQTATGPGTWEIAQSWKNLNSGFGMVTPAARIDVFSTSASPATSGTAQTGIARIGGDAGNVLDIGGYVGSPLGLWLQGNNAANLATHYPIVLNPLGGNVGIANANPGSTLDVIGTFAVSGNAVLSGTTNTLPGTLYPGIDGLGSIGTSGVRYGAVYSYTGNFANLLTAGAGLSVTGTSTVQSIAFSSGSTYNIGTASVFPLNIWGGFIEAVNALVLPSTSSVIGDVDPNLNNTYKLGNAAFKWSQSHITDAFFYSALTAPSGNAGASTTLTCGAGQAVKNITISGGIVTSASCGTP